MDIDEAFTQDAIENFDTNVHGEEEQAVREMVLKVFETNNVTLGGTEVVDISVLCFVAGRTYQADRDSDPKVTLRMSRQMANEVMDYFAQKLEESRE